MCGIWPPLAIFVQPATINHSLTHFPLYCSLSILFSVAGLDTHIHSHTRTHTHCFHISHHTHTHTHIHLHTCTHTHANTASTLSITHMHAHPHTHALTHTRAHARKHTHSFHIIHPFIPCEAILLLGSDPIYSRDKVAVLAGPTEEVYGKPGV